MTLLNKKKHQLIFLTIVLLAILGEHTFYGQIKSRADLVIEIAENSEWENEDKFLEYEIAVLGASDIYDDLAEIAEKQKIKGKPISLLYYTKIKKIKPVQILFISKDKVHKVKEIKKKFAYNTLIITEEYPVNLLEKPSSNFMVNFLPPNKEKKILVLNYKAAIIAKIFFGPQLIVKYGIMEDISRSNDLIDIRASINKHPRDYKTFNTESYDKIQSNEFVSTLENPLSTFSADVDRAAYANVRRFLKTNKLPPPDAVRIEEMLNYFEYDYPQPEGGRPFSFTSEMATCPWNKEHQLISFGIKGKNINLKELPQNNLVFLIDVSGSMSSPNKLPLLKQSFKILLEKLRPTDKVAIVVYAGAAGLVLPPVNCDDKKKIINALDNLQAGGSTAGGQGIKLAYKIAKENFIKGGNNRVILATDGDFNVGASSDGEMVRLIESYRKDDIFLTVLGFGMGNYKDSKMEQISNAGNGNYAYIDNVLEANKTLGKEFFGTIYTIAKDVKIQVEFNPARIKGYRLIGYENRMLKKEDFNNDKKDAGEIGSGHTVTALYEVIPTGSSEKLPGSDSLNYQTTKLIESDEFLTFKLRYKNPKDTVSQLMIKKLKEDELKKEPSLDFKWAAAVVEFGLIIRNSKFKANVSLENVLKTAKNAKGKDENGYRAEFIGLVKKAQLLKQ